LSFDSLNLHIKMYKLGQTGAGELKDIYIRLEIRSPNRGGGLV